MKEVSTRDLWFENSLNLCNFYSNLVKSVCFCMVYLTEAQAVPEPAVRGPGFRHSRSFMALEQYYSGPVRHWSRPLSLTEEPHLAST